MLWRLQGGTPAGRLTPDPGSGSTEERLQRGWKVLKTPVHMLLVTRVVVPRKGGAVMLKCPNVFHYSIASA